MAEEAAQEEQVVEEHVVLERIARRLYAIRYAPVPELTHKNSLVLHHAAVKYRTEAWAGLSEEAQSVWLALASDLLDHAFGDDG